MATLHPTEDFADAVPEGTLQSLNFHCEWRG